MRLKWGEKAQLLALMSERPAKRRRFEGPLGIKFLLSSNLVGGVIGKQGANVKEIMSKLLAMTKDLYANRNQPS